MPRKAPPQVQHRVVHVLKDDVFQKLVQKANKYDLMVNKNDSRASDSTTDSALNQRGEGSVVSNVAFGLKSLADREENEESNNDIVDFDSVLFDFTSKQKDQARDIISALQHHKQIRLNGKTISLDGKEHDLTTILRKLLLGSRKNNSDAETSFIHFMDHPIRQSTVRSVHELPDSNWMWIGK